MSASPSLCERECIMAIRADAPSAMSSAGGQRAITRSSRAMTGNLNSCSGCHQPVRRGVFQTVGQPQTDLAC